MAERPPARRAEARGRRRAYARTRAAGVRAAADDATPRLARARKDGPPGRRRPTRPAERRLYALAAAVFAVAIVVGASALPSGDGPARKLGAPRWPRRAARHALHRIAPRRRRPVTRRSSCAAITSRSQGLHRRRSLPRRRSLLLRHDARGSSRPRSKHGDDGRRRAEAASARAAAAVIDLAPAARSAGDDRCDLGGPAKRRRPKCLSANSSLDNNRIWMGVHGRADRRSGRPEGARRRHEAAQPRSHRSRSPTTATRSRSPNTDFPDGYRRR